jgi:hypothetical protein
MRLTCGYPVVGCVLARLKLLWQPAGRRKTGFEPGVGGACKPPAAKQARYTRRSFTPRAAVRCAFLWYERDPQTHRQHQVLRASSQLQKATRGQSDSAPRPMAVLPGQPAAGWRRDAAAPGLRFCRLPLSPFFASVLSSQLSAMNQLSARR